jgi:hypothetical protein
MYWTVWLIAFGAFLVSGVLFLDHVLEKIISATGGVILVSLGIHTIRDREVHRWVRDISIVVMTVVSLGIWLVWLR